MSDFPLVRLAMRAHGSGSVSVDGIEMQHVTKVVVEAEAQCLTRVTITMCAHVEVTSDDVEVVLERIDPIARAIAAHT